MMLLRIVVLLVTVAITSCASVDFDVSRDTSYAISPEKSRHTVMGSYAYQLTEGQPDRVSRFHMLPNAVDALAIRLLLAERAEMTLDAHYYLVKADDAGFAFISALLSAADRGGQGQAPD